MNPNINSKNISHIIDSIYSHGNDIIIFINKRNTDQILKLFRFLINNIEIIYLPTKEYDPYQIGNLSYNETGFTRVKALYQISKSDKKKIIISHNENIFYRYPNNLNDLFIEFPNNFSREKIISKLVDFGYFRTNNVSGLNEFSVNGEIVNILSRNGLFQIVYEWDKISKLYQIDQKISTSEDLRESNKILIDNFTIFANNEVINSDSGPRKNLEFIYPKFFKESKLILDFLNNPIILHDKFFKNSINIYQNFITESYDNLIFSNPLASILQPDKLFFSKEEINAKLNQHKSYENNIVDDINLNLKTPNINHEDFLIEDLEKNKNLTKVIFCDDSHISYIQDLLLSNDILFNEIQDFRDAKIQEVNIAKINIESGFLYKNSIFYSSIEIFGKVKSQIKKSNSKQLKNILIDINNFECGEYIVHSDYGIGIFKGSEIITALNIKHECIKLEYFNNDILYVPVENIDSITKYGEQDFVELDKLGASAWQRKKAALKEKSFEYAKKLVEIAAKRSLSKSYNFALNNDLFNSFLNKFPYIETEDQIQAANDILLDFNSPIFMDRLICGDVGYGKTEIAMRAAFAISKANLFGNKLVLVVVPTTILCQQHYMSFKKRLSGFDVKIETISRHTSKSNLNKIKDRIKNEDVDIIIGTHALFSDNIELHNLGLLIIDEEHSFGVKQKEKIKSSHPDIHVLSMSATPIPRSLQMSLIGLRDLSIIATPPIGRKNVEIDIIDIDFSKIREILLKKISQGGLSLFVAPRIEDLNPVSENLAKYVPELSYRIAHGKMDPKEIEIIMEDFHHGRFDILLCTIIVGSGIDISLANNIIIYKADMFGLSQLYQLKGRVGRSDMESTAFLAINSSSMLRAKTARRIEIMKGLNHIGAGFAVASHDMDIRGFGNIIGEEQSGNIKHVGIELYKEMLEESIAQIREDRSYSKDLSTVINIGLEVYIPETYIKDSDDRLRIYRHIGQIENDIEITEYMSVIISKYGLIPQELINLFDIVSIKNLCKTLAIKQVDIGPKAVSITFSEDHNMGEKIMNFINRYPHLTKLRGENKLIYLQSYQDSDKAKNIKSLIRSFA